MRVQLANNRQAPGWAWDVIPSAKFDRNAIELPRYASIEAAFERDLHQLVGDYVRGRIGDGDVMRAFKERLWQAETDAFIAGRRARGIARPDVSDAEAAMLHRRHAGNLKYFQQFAADMKAGRGRMNYFNRASMYAQSLWSLYTRGESTDWDDPERALGRRYPWILDVDAEHCKDCLERARQSRDQGGFTWDELIEIGWPGDGRTRCLTKCRCHVGDKAGVRQPDPRRVPPAATAAPNAEKGFRTLEELLEDYDDRIPAAGVPYVNIAADAVASMLQASSRASELGRLLPLVPKALSEPADVIDLGRERHYLGQGMLLSVQRTPSGYWELVGLSLLNELMRKEAA